MKFNTLPKAVRTINYFSSEGQDLITMNLWNGKKKTILEPNSKETMKLILEDLKKYEVKEL